MHCPDAEKNRTQTGLQIPHLLRNSVSLGRSAEDVSGIRPLRENSAQLLDLDRLLHWQANCLAHNRSEDSVSLINKMMTKQAFKRLAYCSIFETYMNSRKSSSKAVGLPRKTKFQNAVFQTRQAGRSLRRQTGAVFAA